MTVEQNTLQLKVPNFLTIPEIQSFILDKQSWVAKQVAKQQLLVQSEMHYRSGDRFLLLGQWWQLQLETGNSFSQQIDQHACQITMSIPKRVTKTTEYVKAKLQAFYMLQAQQLIPKIVGHYEQVTKLTSSSVEFKFYKRRWGCCYRSGKIIFNPMLMAAPQSVIECVVIHELCHLKHMDHSKSFWQLNDKYCGKCKESDKWLNQHLPALTLK